MAERTGTGTWSGVRDPVRRAALAAGAGRPPLPLTQQEALDQALMLRNERDLSYGSIAVVMGIYHGQWATEVAWRERLRIAGVRPRGRGRSIEGWAA